MTQTNSILLSLLLCTLITAPVLSREEVIYLVEVSRHGARTPTAFHFDQPWTQGIDKEDVTPVGLRQHYTLGREIRKKYPGVFPGRRLMGDEYYIRSSGTSRTFKSAVAHMQGIWEHYEKLELPFPNGDDRISSIEETTRDPNPPEYKTPLQNGLLVSPIHTESLDEDDLIALSLSDMCQPFKIQATSLISNFAAKVNANSHFVNKVKQVANIYGVDPATRSSMFDLCVDLGDFAIQDVRHNPSPKLSQSDPLFRLVQTCFNARTFLPYTDNNLLRIGVANLVDDITSKLSSRVTYGTNDKMRYNLYMSHDHVLLPLLLLAGAIDRDCHLDRLSKVDPDLQCQGEYPDTASSLFFELVSESSENYVRLLYNFEPIDFCGLGNSDTTFRCPIDNFTTKWRQAVDLNWRKWCGSPNYVKNIEIDTRNVWKSRAVSLIVASSVLFGLIVFVAITLAVKASRRRVLLAKKNASLTDYSLVG